MATNTNESVFCNACNETCHNRRCTQCKSASYCSKECQVADWPTHKLLCKSFSNFDLSSRESSEYSRAILFPVNGKPKVIWLHCKWVDSEDSRYQHPETDSLLGADPFPKHAPIRYNVLLKRDLLDTIYICHRDTFLIDGSLPNGSIAAITSTKSGQFHDWRGPIIAYGMLGLSTDPDECRDLDMEDFRHVVDYFLSYNYKPVPIRIKAVRINCRGDQILHNRPNFEATEVPSTHSIFSSHSISDIANRLEFPIFTQRCQSDPTWADPSNDEMSGISDPLGNQYATFLHLCCDPDSGLETSPGSLGWAWAPQQWQHNVGSVLVVRQDMKPLFPVQMEALCKYCRYDARAFLAHSIGEYSPEKPLAKETALSMICRAAFVISWYKMLDGRNDIEALETPNPYEE